MIRFKTFRIRNAQPFEKVDMDLDRKGLVRLVGKNGAGKSSLFNLLTFLIFGTHPNKSTKSDVMVEPKNFLLELFFSKNGIDYCIAQATKSKMINPKGEEYGTGFFLFQHVEGVWEDKSQHKALDTQKIVKDIIGWSLEEWHGYVFLSQQTSHTLIMGTRSERQRYLSSLFRLDPLDKVQEHYKLKAERFAKDIEEIERKKHESEVLSNLLKGYPELAAIEGDILNLAGERDLMQGELYQCQSGQKEYETKISLEAEYATLAPVADVDVTALQQEIDDYRTWQAEVRAASTRFINLTRERDDLEAQVKALPTDIPKDFQDIMAGPDLDEDVERKLSSLEKLATTLPSVLPVEPEGLPADAEEILSGPDINLFRYEQDIKTIQSRPAPPEGKRPSPEEIEQETEALNQLKAFKMQLEGEIQRLSVTGDECPTCGQTLDCDDRGTKKEDAGIQLQGAVDSIEEVQATIKQLKSRENLWLAYDKLGPDRTSELPGLLSEVENYRKKVQYQKQKTQIEQYQNVREGFDKVLEIPKLQEKIQNYKKKLSYKKLEESYRSREQLEVQLVRLQKELEEMKGYAQTEPDPSYIPTREKKIEQAKRLKELSKELAELPGDLLDLSETIRILEGGVSELSGQEKVLHEQKKKVLELTERVGALDLWVSERAATYQEQKKCEVLAKAYGKAGKIRQLQLSRFCSYLENSLMLHTVRQLPNYRFYFVAEDGVDLLVSKNGSKPYDVCQMSGGEKGALSVALLFALDSMQAPSRRTALKVVDESESAFDSERKSDFLDSTVPALKDIAETVIVISHSEISNPILFDRNWQVQDGKLYQTSSLN